MPMVSLKLMAGAARSMVVASCLTAAEIAARWWGRGGESAPPVVSVKRDPATVFLNRNLGECDSLFLPYKLVARRPFRFPTDAASCAP